LGIFPYYIGPLDIILYISSLPQDGKLRLAGGRSEQRQRVLSFLPVHRIELAKLDVSEEGLALAFLLKLPLTQFTFLYILHHHHHHLYSVVVAGWCVFFLLYVVVGASGPAIKKCIISIGLEVGSWNSFLQRKVQLKISCLTIIKKDLLITVSKPEESFHFQCVCVWNKWE
jgi:hypothetical protein